MPYTPEQKLLMDIHDKVARIDEKVGRLSEIEKTADDAYQIARDAKASTSSAHKRLDKVDKTIFWVTTTFIGAMILGIVNLLINGGN